MRHRKAGFKFNRTSSHMDAMFRNMVTSLFKYDQIRTTDAKAKELRRWADKVITLAKRGDLHARRQALSIVREKNVVHKLFEEAARRFGNVSGGYTRLVKIGTRPGDAATVTLVELISTEKKDPRKKAKKKAKAEAAPAPAEKEKAPAEQKTAKTAEAAPAQEAKPAETTEAEAAETLAEPQEAVEAEAEQKPDQEAAPETPEPAQPETPAAEDDTQSPEKDK